MEVGEPERSDQRLVPEESPNSSNGGFVENIEKVPFDVDVGATLESALFDYGGSQEQDEAVNVPVGVRAETLFLHVGTYLLLPLFEVPVVTAAAQWRLLEVLNAVRAKVSKDLLVRGVEPEASASRSVRSQGNLLFRRVQFS